MSELLDEAGAAEFLSVKASTLTRWRFERRGPAFIKVGKAVRYRRADLERFIEAGRVETDAGGANAR